MKKAVKTSIVVLGTLIFFTSLYSAQSRRNKRDQPEKLLEIAGVKPGMTIGEAGAGAGYFTFFLSSWVGDRGRIYANDIDKQALQILSNRCKSEGVKNIEIVFGEITDPCFPVTDMDMVIMLYAFHDFTEKEAWLRNVKKYMKKGASLVIFDGQDAHTGMNRELVDNLGEKTGFDLLKHEQLHNGIWMYVLQQEKGDDISVDNKIFEENDQSSGFDFSAMDKIWEITSILERDEEPSEDTWNALIRTPGYAALISHERYYGLDFLKRNFRLVFKPSMTGELEKVTDNRSVQHFLDIKKRKAEIKDFQFKMQDPSVQAKSIELLNPWFPTGTLYDREPIPASFIVFAKDARGGYGRLIFDVIYALERGEEFIPLFAHEAFHYFRGKLMAYHEGDVLLSHQYILRAVDMIQNEGMADQIDKTNTLFEGGSRFDSSYALSYRENMAETPRILRTLDDLLFQLTEDNPRYSEIGRDMRSAVPMSGHPTGYFMTRAILERLGKEELVRTFNNPFAFFYLYNIAALKDPGLPRLSNSAILGLHKMEKKYVIRPETELAAASVFSGIDFSAVENFRKITAVLKQDKKPESKLWDRFFSNQGYRALFTHETSYSREKISELISLVFKPSRENELNAALAEGRSYRLNHFVRHMKEMDSVFKAVEQYRDGQFFNRAVNQVTTLLPPKAIEDIFAPLVSFIYFADDLRYGYPVMLVDPMYLAGEPVSFSYYLKLYLIWVSADRVQPFHEEKLTLRQYAFFDGLKRIQLYGFCDLLSFEDGSLENMDVYSRYQNDVSEVPQRIRELNILLTRAADSPEVWEEFSAAINTFFTRPGCPVGYIMAKTIEKVFDREVLAECFGNPFAFIRLYQKSAAKKGDLPVFSSKSLNYISQLESECFRLDQKDMN